MTIGLNSTLTLSSATAAAFTAWGSAISTAMSTIGWVQTADTGQVAWGGTPSPPSSSYATYYEIWKMNDTAQSTSPVFLKIQYGYSTTNWGLQFSVGQGSNGSGTLTGTISTLFGGQTTLGNAASTSSCYIAGTSGSLTLALGNSSTTTSLSQAATFVIERFLDSSGTATTAGVSCLYLPIQNGTNGNVWYYSYTYSGAFAYTTSSAVLTGVVCPAATLFMTGPNTVPALPIFPLAGQVLNPFKGLMSCSSTDVVLNSSISVTNMYGGTHTYNVLGGSYSGSCLSSNNRLLMLFE